MSISTRKQNLKWARRRKNKRRLKNLREIERKQEEQIRAEIHEKLEENVKRENWLDAIVVIMTIGIFAAIIFL